MGVGVRNSLCAYLLEIIDRKGKRVRLTEKQWEHITLEHPDVSNVDEIRDVIERPIAVKLSYLDPENAEWFFRYDKQKRKYLFVSVKCSKSEAFWHARSFINFRAYLNGDGFIITAHYRRSIP